MIDIDFKYYRSILWRHLPLILVVWMLVSGASIAIAYLLPPVYSSTARILVEKPQIDPTLASQTVNISSEEIIQAIQERMMTRANMFELAERLNVFSDRPDLSPSQKVDRMRASTLFDIIVLGRDRRSPSTTVFTVSFEHKNPQLTAQVTNEYISLILAQNVKLRTDRVTNTTNFFDQEVTRLSGELADLEAQIVSFENENADALPNSLNFRMQEISRLQTRLLQIDTQELSLQDQKTQLERVIADPSLAPFVSGAQQSPEEAQLAQLNSQMVQLKAIYSDTNTKVIQLQAQISALEETIRGGTSSAGTPTTGPSQTQSNLDQINANLEFLKRQRRDLEAELDRLKTTIDATPNVGMQLNVLRRSHTALQNQFDAAVQRLNAAATGESIEVRQQGERFEVIEQANVPEAPVSPNRVLIAGGGIFGGLGLGLGLMVLLELLNRSIRRPVELVNALGIQPFGTVPYIATHGEVLRARFKTSFAILLVGIGIPAILYVIHYQYMPIDLILSKVAERFGLDDLARNFS